MERRGVAVCAVVGSLGLLSAALAFAAEATRVKASDVQVPESGQCVYPKSPALFLGLTSAVALMMAQAIINTVAGCICCKKHPHPSDKNWTVALVSFIVSWYFYICFNVKAKDIQYCCVHVFEFFPFCSNYIFVSGC